MSRRSIEADTRGASGRGHPAGPLTVSRSFLSALNVGAVEAAMAMCSPVAELRPSPAARARMVNVRKPAMAADSSLASASAIVVFRADTTVSAVALVDGSPSGIEVAQIRTCSCVASPEWRSETTSPWRPFSVTGRGAARNRSRFAPVTIGPGGIVLVVTRARSDSRFYLEEAIAPRGGGRCRLTAKRFGERVGSGESQALGTV